MFQHNCIASPAVISLGPYTSASIQSARCKRLTFDQYDTVVLGFTPLHHNFPYKL